MEYSNYQLFIRSYNLAINHLLNGDYKKAHRATLKAMDYYHGYMCELEGINKLKAMQFNKAIINLERLLSNKLDTLNIDVDHGEILSGVAGHEHVKEELKRRIIYPQLYPALYEKFNKHSGGGILMYGVPGTGKTKIACQLAKEIDFNFIEVKCSTVISKFFGETEKNIKEIFDKARKYERAIIFFDEFEALGAIRGKETNSPMGRVVSELLSQIQGFNDDNNFILLAATNRPWDIDTAFLRPGRFSSIIHVGLPDRMARKSIFTSEIYGASLTKDFNVEKFLDATEGFNAADVVEFCERLKECAILRIINTKKDSLIENSDIDVVASFVKSSVNQDDLKRITEYTINR